MLSYLRKYNGEAVLVVLNMSAQPQTVKLDLATEGFAGASAKVLLTSGGPADTVKVSAVKMAPFSAYIAKVVPTTGATKAAKKKSGGGR